MIIFRWVKALLLATTVVIGVRIFSDGLGYVQLASAAGYVAASLVIIGAVLAVAGVIHDRKNPPTL